MSLFKSTERCDNCYGACFTYDYYENDKNGNPKQKPCSKCGGKGYVEVDKEED